MHQFQKVDKRDDRSTVQRQMVQRQQGVQLHPTDIIQRARMNPASLSAGDVTQLQSTIGNRAVYQLMAKNHEGEHPIQGAGLEKPNNTGMPGEVLQKMENSFNTDFSNVKVHPNSAKANQVGALAYTQGSDIHFAPGQLKPKSQEGQKLIGHELTHVVQQRQGRVKPTLQLSGLPVNDDKRLEKEADIKGARAAQGKFEGETMQGAVQHYRKPKANTPIQCSGLSYLPDIKNKYDNIESAKDEIRRVYERPMKNANVNQFVSPIKGFFQKFLQLTPQQKYQQQRIKNNFLYNQYMRQ